MALTWDQVSAITSKKFLPKLVDNIFDSNPLYMRMKERNLIKLDGGTKILQPLNYARNSAAGWYSGSETLDTSDNQSITSAEYLWKFFYSNITILRTEELQNSGDSAKLSLVKSKVEIAEKTLKDDLGTALYNDGSDSKALHGLRFIVSASNTVGTISQSSNSWWQAQLDSTTTTLTMTALQAIDTACSIGQDVPTLVSSTRSIYNSYYALLQPQQRFQSDGMARGGFTSLMFNGKPFVHDSHCPTGYCFFLNEKYVPIFVHRDENMRFEPFIKPVNQNLRTGKIYLAANLAPSNNRMQGALTAITD